MNAQSLLAVVLALVLFVPTAHAADWDPATTRVFIVCLCSYKGKAEPDFPTEGRTDNDLVKVFKDRGVPTSQLVFLQDDKATTAAIGREFTKFLRESRKGETLIVYFGSHGEYDPEKGIHSFSTYDGTLPCIAFFNAIETGFKGSQALLFADCCYSGGICEIALKRRSRIAYACLSSTYSHNVAWSKWRFVNCLIRGFKGDALVDLDGDRSLELIELAKYTEKYMAFAAEGRPQFAATRGFDPRLKLADAPKRPEHAEVGKLVEVDLKGKWHRAEIANVEGEKYAVRFVDAPYAPKDRTVKAAQIRTPEPRRFAAGTRVMAKGASSGKWYPATVLGNWESLHFVRWDDYSPAYDEWVGPSRIRPARQR